MAMCYKKILFVYSLDTITVSYGQSYATIPQDQLPSGLSSGMTLKETLVRRLGKVHMKYVVLLVPLQACRRPPDLYLTLP